MEQSELLTKFYNAYNLWVENGAPATGTPFSRGIGLCSNIEYWALINRMSYIIVDQLQTELHNQFCQVEGINPHHPFGEADYFRRTFNNTMHECPNRMAWVKAHLS